MLYVVNYANGEPFESFRRISSQTAKWFGRVDRVIEYTQSDIPESYKNEHVKIFSYKRGAGLWLWKPWLILDALKKIDYGDWLFYGDAGVTYIRDIHHLVRCAEAQEQDIVLFEQPLLSRQFTKRECYEFLNLTDHGENQVLALLFLQKTKKSLLFIEEWLHLCEREELLSPNHFYPEIKEWDDYYEHREDQSILNLLRLKYNIPVFRDCSDYGEMPYMNACKSYKYNPKQYDNSPYPTLILCNRKVHPLKYFFKYLLKKVLNKTGLYYTEKKELEKRLK